VSKKPQNVWYLSPEALRGRYRAVKYSMERNHYQITWFLSCGGSVQSCAEQVAYTARWLGAVPVDDAPDLRAVFLQRRGLVVVPQVRIPDHVGAQDRGEFALGSFRRHGFLPRRGMPGVESDSGDRSVDH
jgi:hypothetical protein